MKRNKIKFNKKHIPAFLLLAVIAGIIGINIYTPNNQDKSNSNFTNMFLTDSDNRKITNTKYDYKQIDNHIIVEADKNNLPNDAIKISENLYLVNKENFHKKFNTVSYEDGLIEATSNEITNNDIMNSLEEQESSVPLSNEEIKEQIENFKYTKLHDFLSSENNLNHKVRVAILDSGISNKMMENPRYLKGINYSATGNDTLDDNGHGTEIALEIENTTGDNVEFLPIKVLDSSGRGTITALYQGILYAIENKADIINISISSTSLNDELVKKAIDEATSKGIIIVVSAGNSYQDASYFTPAKYDDVITVSAVKANLSNTEYSNFGDCIDYAAISESGTSIATAKVTAIIANLLGADNTRNKTDIEAILNKYAITEGLNKKYIGNGVLANGYIIDADKDEVMKEFICSILSYSNWKDLSVLQLNNVLDKSSDEEIAIFIKTISEKDREYLITKNVFTKEEIEKYLQFEITNNSVEAMASTTINMDVWAIVSSARGQASSYGDAGEAAGTIYLRHKYTATKHNPGTPYPYYLNSIGWVSGSWIADSPKYTIDVNPIIDGVQYNCGKEGFKFYIEERVNSWTSPECIDYYGTFDFTKDYWIWIRQDWIPLGYKLVGAQTYYHNPTATLWYYYDITHLSTSAAEIKKPEYKKKDYTLTLQIAEEDKDKIEYFKIKDGTALYGDYNETLTTVAKAKDGYHLTYAEGTTLDGKSTARWDGCDGKTNEWKTTWTMCANRTITLHAETNAFNVIYNANGGAMVGNQDSSYTVTYTPGSKVSGEIPTGTELRVEKPGYKLVKWNTKADGTGNDYEIGSSIDSAQTLYAIWEKIPGSSEEYYIADGNTGVTITYYNTVETKEPTNSITKPTKSPLIKDGKTTNYTFNGYYTGTNGSGEKIINSNGIIDADSTKFSSNTTLYAYWTTTQSTNPPPATQTYTVTYDPGDGSGALSIKSVNEGTNHTILGHSFTAPQGKKALLNNEKYVYKVKETGQTVYSTDSITVDRNLTLVAQYENRTDLTAKVYYYYLKQDGNENNIDDYILDVTENKTIYGLTYLSTFNATSHNGINYVMSNKVGFELQSFGTPTSIKVTSNESNNIVQVYLKRIKYTVTLNKDTEINSVSGAGTYYYGQTVNISAKANSGYTFNTWTKNSPTTLSLDKNTSINENSFTMPASNVTLTANSRTATHNVTLIPNGTVITFNGRQYTTPVTIPSVADYSQHTVTCSKPGYNCGLEVSSVTKDSKISGTTFTMGTSDTTIIASKSAAETSYQVYHWVQKIGGNANSYDSNNYALYDGLAKNPITSSALTDSYVEPPLLSEDNILGLTAMSGTKRVQVKADGSTRIDYYYRRNVATFNYNTNSGVLSSTPYAYGGKYYKLASNVLQQSTSAGGTYSNTQTKALYKDNAFKILNLADLKVSKTGYSLSETNTYLISGSDPAAYLSAKNYYKDINYISKQLETGDKTFNLVAQWNPITYTITLNKANGSGGSDKFYEIYENNKFNNPIAKNNEFYLTDVCDTPVTSISKPSRLGYTFNGYYTGTNGTGTKVVDANGNIVVTNSFFKADTTIYAYWTVNNYTISYNLNDVSASVNPAFGTNHPTTVSYDAAFTVNNPSMKGYNFNKWSVSGMTTDCTHYYGPNTSSFNTTKNATLTPEITDIVFKNLRSTSGTVTFKANWVARTDTKYYVNHYLMNVNGTGYTFKETTEKKGTSDATLTLSDLKKTYTGFTYSNGNATTKTAQSTPPTSIDNPTSIVKTTTILADGTRVINLFYTRNKYTVTLTNGTGIASTSGAGTYYYDASVTIDATVKIGYTWSKWTGTYETSTKKYTFNMPASNVSMTANATPNTYTVKLYPNKPNIALRDYVLKNPSGWTWNNTDKYYSKILTYDAIELIPEISNTFTIESWEPSGWFKEPTGKTLVGTGTKRWNLVTENHGSISLYPQWADIGNPDINDNKSKDEDGKEPTLNDGSYTWDWTNKAITINVIATDIGSGIKQIDFYETNSSYSPSVRTNVKSDAGNGIETKTSSYTVPEGERYYVVVATDRYGNTSELKYHTRYDKVSIKLSPVTVNQQTLASSSSGSIENDIKNGLNTTFTLTINDTNVNSSVNKNVSGLKIAVLEVWDKDNINDKLTYNLLPSNIVRTNNASNNILSCTLSINPNLYADFKNSEFLTWKITVVDYAGNESYVSATNNITNYSSKTFIYNETVDSNGNEIYNDSDENTYFQVGEIGRVEVYTIGYTSNVSLDFKELGKESAIEIKDGRMNEVYRLGTNTDKDMRILYSSDANEIVPGYLRLHDNSNNITKYTNITENMLRNSVGNKYAQHYKFTIQIPPYYELKESGKLRDDGSPLYDSEIHIYEAIVNKGSSSIKPSNKLTLWDNISVSVHYRITHES